MIDHVLTRPVVPKEFELSVPVQRWILNFETFIVCYNFYIKGSSNLFLANVFKWLFAVNVESKFTVLKKKRIRHSPCSICFLVELFFQGSECITYWCFPVELNLTNLNSCLKKEINLMLMVSCWLLWNWENYLFSCLLLVNVYSCLIAVPCRPETRNHFCCWQSELCWTI